MSEIYCQKPEEIQQKNGLIKEKPRYTSTQSLNSPKKNQKGSPKREKTREIRRKHLETKEKNNRNYLSDSEIGRKKRTPHLNATGRPQNKLRSPIGPLEATPHHAKNILNQSPHEERRRGFQNCNSPSLHSVRNLLNQSEYELPHEKRSIGQFKAQRCNCSNLRTPIGPVEAQNCNCSSSHHVKNFLNQSEYEVAHEASKIITKNNENANNFNEDFEFADDAISLNGEMELERSSSRSSINSKNDKFITVNGKEELPISPEQMKSTGNSNISLVEKTDILSNKQFDDEDGILEDKFDTNCNIDSPPNKQYSTFPKRKRNHVNHKMWYRPILEPPHKITPDGTNIYYWCDMPKRPTTGKITLVFLTLSPWYYFSNFKRGESLFSNFFRYHP